MTPWLYLLPLLCSAISSGAPVGSPTSCYEGAPLESLRAYRSTVAIIWTCLTIIVASTWGCIHPHIIGRDGTLSQRVAYRLRLSINGLLFPDHVVQRAFEQWMGCRALYEDTRKRTDGLSLQEGGTVCRTLHDGSSAAEPEAKTKTLTSIGIATVDVDRCSTKDSEQDVSPFRSGGVGGEGANGREHEAQVPEDSQQPAGSGTERASEKLPASGDHKSGTQPDERWFKDFKEWDEDDIRSFFQLKLTRGQLQDKSKADGLAKAFVVIQCLWFVTQCIGRAVSGLPIIEIEVSCLAYIACNLGMHGFWWFKPMNVTWPVEIYRHSDRPKDGAPSTTKASIGVGNWVLAVLQTWLTGDLGLLVDPHEFHDEFKKIKRTSTHYPSNYLYTREDNTTEWDLDEEWGVWTWVAYSIAPAIFGALHSIAWYSSFPSSTERLLWRASCVIPAVHAIMFISMNGTGIGKHDSSSGIAARAARALYLTLLAVFMFISNPINLVARFVFVILPLLQFRNLPPLSHQTVSWSDFLPHV